MKIKFFKKEKSFKREKESLWLNINLYWRLAVFIVIMTTILSLIFGYYLFMKINTEPVLAGSGGSTQIDTAKRERILKVLEYFSLREEKSNQILNSSAPVVDPSL